MRLYLSSFRLGRHPELLATLAGEKAHVGVIANAMDFAAEDARREAVDRELRAMSGLGFRPAEVDLRGYFGDAALLRRDLVAALPVTRPSGKRRLRRRRGRLPGRRDRASRTP